MRLVKCWWKICHFCLTLNLIRSVSDSCTGSAGPGPDPSLHEAHRHGREGSPAHEDQGKVLATKPLGSASIATLCVHHGYVYISSYMLY